MELKPCPFCGKPPLLDPMQDGSDWESVRCINPRCDVQPETDFAPPGTSVEIWNTRQPVTTQEGWQPIETAPKNGAEILGFVGPGYTGGVLVLSYYNLNGKSEWRDWDQDVWEPTHWMPLPVAPEKGAD